MASHVQTAFKNTQVLDVFQSYPTEFQAPLLALRELIFKVATEQSINDVDEVLKWGEPSYLTKDGSTIRLAWRRSSPLHYAIFFNCKTSLVESFKEVYRDTFRFEGNRAIVFGLHDVIALNELKQCVAIAMRYKRLKHLPLLGL